MAGNGFIGAWGGGGKPGKLQLPLMVHATAMHIPFGFQAVRVSDDCLKDSLWLVMTSVFMRICSYF